MHTNDSGGHQNRNEVASLSLSIYVVVSLRLWSRAHVRIDRYICANQPPPRVAGERAWRRRRWFSGKSISPSLSLSLWISNAWYVCSFAISCQMRHTFKCTNLFDHSIICNWSNIDRRVYKEWFYLASVLFANNYSEWLWREKSDRWFIDDNSLTSCKAFFISR